jgi:hypothetical protein
MIKIDLTECVHCGGVTIDAETDICRCGAELYPITKMVGPGTRLHVVNGEIIIDTVPPKSKE